MTLNRIKKNIVSLCKKTDVDYSSKLNTDKHVSIDHVQKIHAHINEMIRFGEAKNGVLLTVNLGVFFKVVFNGMICQNLMLLILNITAILSISISIIVLMLSFFPQMNSQKTFNPIYFGTISQSNPDKYFEYVKNMKEEELIKHYCEQIHITSSIAKYKFDMFKIGICLGLFSFISYGFLYIFK